jgi:hypothetical protein
MGDPARPRRVLLTGTFDVANYGDLLFPLIAQRRLAGAGIEVTPVSPTDNRVPYVDAMRPIAAPCMMSVDADGVLIGGGYIVIGQSAEALAGYRAAGVAHHAYPSLWLGATLAGAVKDVPVIWNAPGSPHPFAASRRAAIVTPALHAASRLAVRDRATARLLAADGLVLDVVPDTALDLPKLWSATELAAVHRDLLARKGLPRTSRTLAIHVRARSLARHPIEALAVQIEELVRHHDVVPMLLALGPDLGDVGVLRQLSAQLTVPHATLADAGSLRELAAAIAGAACYMGGSLHGYITAAAYGVPAVVVALPARPKYLGLLEQIGREADLAVCWPTAFDLVAARLRARSRTVLPASVGAALDRHWDQSVSALGDADSAAASRAAFLRTYIRQGVLSSRAGWIVAPHLSGARPSTSPGGRRPPP